MSDGLTEGATVSAPDLGGHGVHIQVDPSRSMVDERLGIRLTGFEPGQHVTLRASQTDDLARTWRAHANSSPTRTVRSTWPRRRRSAAPMRMPTQWA